MKFGIIVLLASLSLWILSGFFVSSELITSRGYNVTWSNCLIVAAIPIVMMLPGLIWKIDFRASTPVQLYFWWIGSIPLVIYIFVTVSNLNDKIGLPFYIYLASAIGLTSLVLRWQDARSGKVS